MAKKNSTRRTITTKKEPSSLLSPSILDECAAHGKLEAMMQFHYSEEMRTFLKWMWQGFIKDFQFDRDPDPLEKRILNVHDRVAKLHRDYRLQQLQKPGKSAKGGAR